jgi:hypothetical protein
MANLLYPFGFKYPIKGFKSDLHSKKINLPYIEEALRYVELLFLACQKGRITERIELLNLSSRRYLLLKETERISEANLSLFVSELARALVEKASK